MRFPCKIKNNSGLKIVTWGGGTDEEVAAMLEAHYNGDIDIHDYWTVGDERVVSLSAMDAGMYELETHAAQNVTMVLLHSGEYLIGDNDERFDPDTECAFVVGMKDCLNETGRIIQGSVPTTYAFSGTQRGYWLGTQFFEAIPVTLRDIFKKWKHYEYRYKYTSSTNKYIMGEYSGYFDVPNRKELENSAASYVSDGVYLDYYKTSSNRKKKINGVANSTSSYWLRDVASGCGQTTWQQMCFLTDGSGATTNKYSYSSVGFSIMGII